MKILWISNMVMPELANHLGITTGSSGTWMINLSKSLSENNNIKLAIACVYGDEFKKIELNDIIYYLIPGSSKSFLFYDKRLLKYWQIIEQDFSPEIVHIHGTEYTHSISYLRNYPNKKYLLSIQGIVTKIAKVQNADLSFYKLIKYRTFSENLHLNGMIEKKLLSVKNSKYEREIIQKMNYATGRTDWDRAFMLSLNPKLKYYKCFYNLREEFYTALKWNYSTCEKHTVYASTSLQMPLKGGHIVLKALSLVKKKFPNVKVRFLAKNDNGKLLLDNGYAKYVYSLIKKYDLFNNVEFVNRLNTSGVIDIMQKSHVCVIPSACENASATLRESIHIGTPSIASFRGGMSDLIQNGVSGYFYDFSDYELLALQICELFENKKLCQEFSENSIKFAEKIHNQKKNTQDFLDMYKDILEREGI